MSEPDPGSAAGSTDSRTAGSVEALVFDLDDTLLDHGGSARRGLTTWLTELGAEPTEQLIMVWFALEEEHFAAWRRGEISFAEQRRRRLRDFLPRLGRAVPTADDDLDAVFEAYRVRYEQAWRPFDDVLPALTRLTHRGVPVAVLTNGAEEQQRAKVRAIGVEPLLADTFTAEALGVAKPDRAAYLGVCQALGVEPSRVVHIGDRHDLDVVAARAAGLQALHLDRPGTGPDPAAIRTLTALHDGL